MNDSVDPQYPDTYVQLLTEFASLTSGPMVTNLKLDLGLPAEYMDEPNENTWIDLGCISIEQDSKSGSSTLWHSYSDGPYGDPMNAQFFDRKVGVGEWPMDDDDTHYLEHGIDTYSWSLLNALAQALTRFKDHEFYDHICSGIDEDIVEQLRDKLVDKLSPLEELNCVCGQFASHVATSLRQQLDD